MKIAVIAANGRSGQAFVNAATDSGHTVLAGYFGNNNLPASSNIIAIKCDATNEADLQNLIKDADAVVSLIGHIKGSPPRVQTEAMKHVVNVMAKLGKKRLVSLTGTGVRQPGDKITLLDRVLNMGIRIIDPNRVKDGIEHVQVLKNSQLDWTVIRVLKLQNVKPKPFSLQANGPTKPYVSRQDVAAAIVEVITKGSFVRQAPIISRHLKTEE